MKIVLLKFLKEIINLLFLDKKAKSGKLITYSYTEFGRNMPCYCNSGKKYKNCHLVLNEKKGCIALNKIDNQGKVEIELRKKSSYNIAVQNSFSEVNIGGGA